MLMPLLITPNLRSFTATRPFPPNKRFNCTKILYCEQALHIGESREVARELYERRVREAGKESETLQR